MGGHGEMSSCPMSKESVQLSRFGGVTWDILGPQQQNYSSH